MKIYEPLNFTVFFYSFPFFKIFLNFYGFFYFLESNLFFKAIFRDLKSEKGVFIIHG